MYFLTWNHFGYSFAELPALTSAIANGTASEQVMHVYHYTITLAFGAVIACQIGNVLECRHHVSFIKSLKKKNHLMIWGILVEIALFLLIAYIPFIQMLFETTAPKISHLATIAVMSGCPDPFGGNAQMVREKDEAESKGSLIIK